MFCFLKLLALLTLALTLALALALELLVSILFSNELALSTILFIKVKFLELVPLLLVLRLYNIYCLSSFKSIFFNNSSLFRQIIYILILVVVISLLSLK